VGVGLAYGLDGHVDGVLSGNTIMVRNAANVSQPVRLFGVAAPVAGTLFSVSRDRLASQILGNSVYVHTMGFDLDGMTVAKVFYGADYLNQSQIFEGMAWYNADHGLAPDLAEAEMAAQEAGRGVWADPDLVSQWAYAP